ncbi:MAG: hypothetical protein ER33_11345 [Cyanobium sp. CACIAM 14]|nr:MAG: hypothetical protein ER33_11345 [Cyanobium sp. CACIAM 14]
MVPWLDVIGLVKEDFPDSLREQVQSHDLTRSGVILFFQEELQNRMATDLLQTGEMTAERMRGFAAEAGLDVAFQRLSGIADGWGLEDLDAFTVLRQPTLA